MGYEFLITAHELAEDCDFDDILISLCGWEFDSTFWHVFYNLGTDVCGEDEPCTHVEVDCAQFKPLSNILDCISGTFVQDQQMRQLAFDWKTYRRLARLYENGHPELYLEGIGGERFGLMRSCFYVETDNEYIHELCDALCGFCFDPERDGVEHVIKLIDILTSHDTIHVYRSY